MWIVRHKRIPLWYTARNILAIFYIFHIGMVYSCGTVFSDVQSKALLSQIVIVGKVDNLTLTSSEQSQDYRSYTAVVQVLSVLKQPRHWQRNNAISRKQYITISGFLTDSSNSWSSSSNFSSAQPISTTSSVTSSSSNHSCLSYVTLSKDYILFINHTTGINQNRHTYHTAQLSTNYTKTDKKLIRDVLCDNCARAPNAKAKRNIRSSKGTSNYKINCRVDGNPAPQVRWYRNGEELDGSMRGIAIKHRRRKGVHTTSIRFKKLKLDHTGTYKCVAKNLLGEDTAKTTLTVMPDPNEPKTTPPPPLGNVDWGILGNIDEGETIAPTSHYIPCTGKDKNYCLHNGECKIYPDGRYRHCRCLARFTGTRCEEANVISSDFRPDPTPLKVPASMELAPILMPIVIALATVLAMLVILLLILAFYIAGWRYRSQKGKRSSQYTSAYNRTEANSLLEYSEAKLRTHPVTQCHTMATQTEPVETSLQKLRRSLNLENHFPHSDVVLRRKSLGAATGRPASQPIDRRLTRSRLSATSTLAESRRENDSEFDVLNEQMPSSASLELASIRSASSCSDNGRPLPHTNCDHQRANSNSLHISESMLDSSDSDRSNDSPQSDNVHPDNRLPKEPLYTDKNANARKYNYHLHNGDP